jgi:hypothetical protein
MFQSKAYYFLLILSFTLSSFTALAQPILPDIAGASEKGINVLSWTCEYDGIKSIAVQRSADSVYNYSTVGYVKNLKKGLQAFIDGHPAPGKNWYRLYIVFNSDLTWYSNRLNLVVDSADIRNKRVLPPNDSLQKLAANIKIEARPVTSERPVTSAPATGTTTTRIVLTIPDDGSEIEGVSYIKSQHVFTNPFTGHVNLELEDYNRHHYSVNFYNDKEKRVLEIPRVTEPQIIIDKRNFQRKGIYKFELRQDRKVLETGYITIY